MTTCLVKDLSTYKVHVEGIFKMEDKICFKI